jgi:hypothetical protein
MTQTLTTKGHCCDSYQFYFEDVKKDRPRTFHWPQHRWLDAASGAAHHVGAAVLRHPTRVSERRIIKVIKEHKHGTRTW